MWYTRHANITEITTLRVDYFFQLKGNLSIKYIHSLLIIRA